MLRLLAAQAAVAIEHASLRTRMDALALTLTDDLTGVASRRMLSRSSRASWPARAAPTCP